ncbi:MAG: tryptophan synthase subunit alpha, partial [Chloroflexi bacterium]|nr:tryptophan synthase subunit alpha [Chloroflexota bacterium]
VPFSDPLGDGPTVQRAGFAALTNGVTPAACIEAVRQIRARGVTVPLLLMGYVNNVLSYGQEAFCRDLADAGGDGFIIVDLPPEEAEDLRQTCGLLGLDLIFLLAPTSTETRIEQVARLASGFIYCVSLNGVTGARSQISAGLPAFLERVRAHTSLPLAVGFGISTREHVEQLTGLADAVVVGSAVINTADRAPRGTEAAALRAYVESLSRRHAEPTHR